MELSSRTTIGLRGALAPAPRLEAERRPDKADAERASGPRAADPQVDLPDRVERTGSTAGPSSRGPRRLRSPPGVSTGRSRDGGGRAS